MNVDEWRSSTLAGLLHRELARLIEEKALHFASSPPEGYLAGYSPRDRPDPSIHDERLAHVTGWNSALSWLYAVAAQDIPDLSYRWEIVGLQDGRFKLVLEPVEPPDE